VHRHVATRSLTLNHPSFFHISPREALSMDPQQMFGVALDISDGCDLVLHLTRSMNLRYSTFYSLLRLFFTLDDDANSFFQETLPDTWLNPEETDIASTSSTSNMMNFPHELFTHSLRIFPPAFAPILVPTIRDGYGRSLPRC